MGKIIEGFRPGTAFFTEAGKYVNGDTPTDKLTAALKKCGYTLKDYGPKTPPVEPPATSIATSATTSGDGEAGAPVGEGALSIPVGPKAEANRDALA